ncbi:MAG: Rrf2 family protein [Candidatus Poriferisodalaceae bacterium]
MTAKVDYAVRATLELAASNGGRVTRDELATAQDIPRRYLEAVLAQLRQAGIVVGQRGTAGGYTLGRPADEITIAEIARAVDGPLALIQGLRPENVTYKGNSENLAGLWVGLRAAMRSVMESVTLDDVLNGELPDEVQLLISDPDSWEPR